MNARTNEGFLILDSIHAGSSEFVLGINMHVADSFVTWKCDKGTNYYWGHYHSDLLTAQKDLAERALAELSILKDQELPLPHYNSKHHER